MDPDTSHTSTSGRGRVPGSRQWRSSGSPWVRRDARTVRRRSGRAPCGGAPRRREGRLRRLGRLGSEAASRRMARRARRRSSALYSAKSLSRSSSMSDQAAGTTSAPPSCSAAVRRPGTATRRQDERGDLVERGGGTGGLGGGRPEPLGKRGVEGREVVVTRAERRAQREVGGRAIRRIDRRERAVGGQHLADAQRTPPARRAAASSVSRPVTRAPALPTLQDPALADLLDVLADLQRPRRASSRGHPRRARAMPAPRRSSRRRRAACRAPRRAGARRRADPPGDRVGHARQAGAHDLRLALGRGVVDPVVEAAPLERVVQLARAVRGDDHERPALAR